MVVQDKECMFSWETREFASPTKILEVGQLLVGTPSKTEGQIARISLKMPLAQRINTGMVHIVQALLLDQHMALLKTHFLLV